MGWMEIAMNVVCPTLGVLLSNCLFAAPVLDLKKALKAGRLGDLNPAPFPMQTGNCLGWIVYGYYTGCDPFLLASNIPGLIVSIWLNSGAAKLQFMEASQSIQQEQEAGPNNNNNDDDGDDANNDNEEANGGNGNSETATGNHPAEAEWDAYAPLVDSASGPVAPPNLVTVPVEQMLLYVLCFWSVVIVAVTFTMHAKAAAATIGVIVNINLIFFYAAPLQTMKQVIASKNSASIHRLTMYTNWFNTSFWLAYGVAIVDFYIMIPNALGLAMGLTMGVLCLCYPRRTQQHDASLLEPLNSPAATSQETEQQIV